MYKELLEYIVKSLANQKNEVQIIQTIAKDNKKELELKVAKEDMGRIIGKEGRIIRSIRELLNAYAIKNGDNVFVKIKENEE